MDAHRNGKLIKFLRKSKKMTQADLAHGICSVRQLQRIEKGECHPSINHFERFLAKLGESTKKYAYNFTNVSDEKSYYDANEIESLIYKSKYDDAKDKYDKLIRSGTLSLDNDYNLQFSLYCEMAFLFKLEKNEKEALVKAYEAISFTIKNFHIDYIEKSILTKLDYYILNCMALIYLSLGEDETGISILSKLKTLLQNNSYSDDIREIMLPMICYNLSKHLGLFKKYEEAIAVGKEGIDICQELQSLKHLGGLLYNRAYDFYYLDNLDEAKNNFNLAYYAFKLAKNEKMAEITKENAIKKYNILLH